MIKADRRKREIVRKYEKLLKTRTWYALFKLNFLGALNEDHLSVAGQYLGHYKVAMWADSLGFDVDYNRYDVGN